MHLLLKYVALKYDFGGDGKWFKNPNIWKKHGTWVKSFVLLLQNK